MGAIGEGGRGELTPSAPGVDFYFPNVSIYTFDVLPKEKDDSCTRFRVEARKVVEKLIVFHPPPRAKCPPLFSRPLSKVVCVQRSTVAASRAQHGDRSVIRYHVRQWG